MDKLDYYQEELDRLNGNRQTILRLIEALKQFIGPDFESKDEEIERLISEFNDEIIPSYDSKMRLSSYIERLEWFVEFIQDEINEINEKIEELQRPPPPTLEETDSKLRITVHETNVELFSKLLPLLLRRVEYLRKRLNCEDCSPHVLLQNIISILELDDQESVSRIIDYFEDKSREQILSDHGLVIILALSNIAGYSGEYERSMKGMFLDDKWMFDQLFEEEPKFGLVSFPSLVYRAFENSFIQSSFLIENELLRENFKTSLRYMNDFSRRLHDINHEVLLTMDSSSFSNGSMLYADGYFLRVPDIWHILQTSSE